MFGPIKYRKGYKYVLHETVEGYGPIKPKQDVFTDHVKLYMDGKLVVLKHFPWDGASGPTLDTKSVMTPSLRHDAYCLLHKLGYISEADRKTADKLLAKDMRARGSWFIRARLWYRGVRLESKHHKHTPKRIYFAP